MLSMVSDTSQADAMVAVEGVAGPALSTAPKPGLVESCRSWTGDPTGIEISIGNSRKLSAGAVLTDNSRELLEDLVAVRCGCPPDALPAGSRSKARGTRARLCGSTQAL